MATVENAMVFILLFTAAVEVSRSVGEIHKVGDSEGWTVGNISYTSWAAKKTFHVGDTIIFEYNNQFHNVLQVTRANYRRCNATSPLATFTAGNDSIPIKRKGHYLFICGFPGHCSVGQKVDIRIIELNAGPASSPTLPPLTQSPPAPSSTAPGGQPAGLNNNHAPSMGLSFFGIAIAAVSSVLFF